MTATDAPVDPEAKEAPAPVGAEAKETTAPAEEAAPVIPANLKQLIAALSEQLFQSPQFADSLRVAQRDQTPATLRTRTAPKVGEIVAYTHISHRSGLPQTQRGIVHALADDTRTAHVIWHPDGAAAMPFDQLDD